jgi:pimeloyl-ACP methyl ester carboxylesterase
MIYLRSLFLLSLITLSLTSMVCGAVQASTDDLKLEPYVFETYDGRKVNAELGRLSVPENRRNPRSRLIELVFVRLKSTASVAGTPLVFLDGGPGSSAIGTAKGVGFDSFMALREMSDVILLDQRGAGMSKPSLDCSQKWDLPLDRPGDAHTFGHLVGEKVSACARELRGKGFDLAGYHTLESATDVEALRRALKLDKINLWGISYGTHLSLAVIRKYGQHIERAILTGVASPEHFPYGFPSLLDEQLQKVDRLVKADPNVSKLIPDLRSLFVSLLKQLETKPVTIEVMDSRTKQKVSVTVGKWDLQFFANRLIYTWGIMDLPSFFYPMSKGDWTPLAERALRYRTEQVAPLMGALVACASTDLGEPFKRIKREAGKSLMGSATSDLMQGMCRALAGDAPNLGKSFRAPVKSDVPVLLISGTLDGSTTLDEGLKVQKSLSRSQHLIVEGASHGYDLFYFTPQVKQTMLEFLKDKPLSTTRIKLSTFPFIPIKQAAAN